MTALSLHGAFSAWSKDRVPLVLASVVETEGSTYSKCGAQMLITADGLFQGMLSGGCLEGDLAERSRAVLASGDPQIVVYDLAGNDEELWGLGVGCDGLMRIFLQPLLPEAGYQPFAAAASEMLGDGVQVMASVVASKIAAVAVGQSMLTLNGETTYSDIPEEFAAALGTDMQQAYQNRCSTTCIIAASSGEATMLLSVLEPAPAILVLGAGLDAEPVVRFAQELGWRITVQDHRPAYLAAGNFAGVEKKLCVPVSDVSAQIDLDRYAAAIVMSHHLASDRQYLLQLAASEIPYIGLLGPVGRRRKLVAELGDAADRLKSRLRGPAGLDIGGRGPAAIALSIVAEMHRELQRHA